eukprot:TRINITY_DN5060_c0_g1_i1.p1 TRINITY_DN5060_c0_g1~~TRINITY_DN5060_c0_g1_i1.p1  ORF type:complete len:171 (+),score=72.20 TRINITY_DN5060_c0_g1_i1:130-642(+)
MMSEEHGNLNLDQQLPKGSFQILNQISEKNFQIQTLTTDELLANKKVVIIGLPGAFTPTCSSTHLPGFIEDYHKLKAKGIDLICCVSVNDAYVMYEWGKQQKVENKILMLADGDASFSQTIGLIKQTDKFGGIRSRRYALIIDNLIVKHIAVDEMGKFEVSSSDAVLSFL